MIGRVLRHPAVAAALQQQRRQAEAEVSELVREATPSYRAQPYQQLAAVSRADGHDIEARAV